MDIDQIQRLIQLGESHQIEFKKTTTQCHRVVGSNGHLVGFAGGVQRKQWLLNHEME